MVVEDKKFDFAGERTAEKMTQASKLVEFVIDHFSTKKNWSEFRATTRVY